MGILNGIRCERKKQLNAGSAGDTGCKGVLARLKDLICKYLE
jgi:hypothetical protein